MTPDGGAPRRPRYAFAAWKLLLRNACELRGMLFTFAAVQDHVLELLWAAGIDPTVKAVLEYPALHKITDPSRAF